MRNNRRRGLELLGLTVEEYRFFYGASNARLAEEYKWVSDYVYVDPDEVRKATLKAWSLLKRNSDLTGEQSDREG